VQLLGPAAPVLAQHHLIIPLAVRLKHDAADAEVAMHRLVVEHESSGLADRP
jgi:hypothetical protein